MTAARRFLACIVDYAGLFPPAALGMEQAVSAYASYRSSEYRDLLGRFILPAQRLDEFSSALQSVAGARRDHNPWSLSLICRAGNDSDLEHFTEFSKARADGSVASCALVDTIEMPVSDSDEVRHAGATFNRGVALFLEPAGINEPAELLRAIAKSGASAKLRTGGVVSSAIPDATAVMHFIDECASLGLAFKATAGLHHALCGTYPLTYEAGSPQARMFGYLNLFLVAAYHKAGLPEAALYDLLDESDPATIAFDENGVEWCGNRLDESQLIAARNSFSVSFGSCSFTEPVEEARQLRLI